ncbi:MAG: aldehyde dehydrogenase family protein [Actinomycetota bacterium]|nr:aldehyde dehydrogenase family protein [Actinomycetota bacterium]
MALPLPKPQNGLLESRAPATGELLGTVPVTSPEEVHRIADEVARVQQGWALVPLIDRLEVIGRAAQVLLRRREEIAEAVSRENGKTVVESGVVEVVNGLATLDWVAKSGRRYLSPERLPAHPLVAHKRHHVEFRPLGVVAVIAPWNYPLVIPLGEVAQGLAAGNGVILKPSEFTPLSGELVADVFAEAGLPDGILRVVHGAGDTGAALCDAEAVRKIFFTGSAATGRKVMEAAARHGKPVMLELGGKDAAIVCADADLDRASSGILWSGLSNCGQTCAGVERIYVDRKVEDELVRRLVEKLWDIRPGDPSDPEVQIGPMNNELQYQKVLDQLADARARGAVVECGGPVEVPGIPGRYVFPAVLTNVDHSMQVMTDETFGPVLPVMAFDGEEEAVELANDSRYGLGASVWTRDIKRGRRLAAKLQAGMVWINDHTYSHGIAQTPWGGVKESGTGVTHSKFGYYEMTEKRLVAEDRGLIPNPWWYPYGGRMRPAFDALIESFYTDAGRIRTAWRRRSDLKAFATELIRRR